jgi:hypothetical protein
MQRVRKCADAIRDVLRRNTRAMSIRDLSSALEPEGFTHAQVKTSCFDMAKREAVLKCGTGGRQLFRLGAGKPKQRFNVPIAPSESIPATRATRGVETIEEWMLRTGRTVQRLPIGATAFPLRRIAA